MSMAKCLFFQDLEGLTEVFGRMSAGTSGRKLPLWADFSFLKNPAKRGREEGDGTENVINCRDVCRKLS